MTPLPYLLVVISATTHATWNFLAKRSGGSQMFLGLSKAAEAILLLPFFVFFAIQQRAPLDEPFTWVLFGVGAFFTTMNYIFLGRAYARGSLSTVYPVARSSALIFLPALAYMFIGERIDWIGGSAIALIILGIFTLQLDRFGWREVAGIAQQLRHPAMLYALVAGFAVACYSLWDKNALRYLPTFIYFYGYTALAAMAYFALLRMRFSWEALRGEIAGQGRLIVVVGMLNTFTYLLVLAALAVSKASYVVALRQLSIGIGAVMGWRWLGEPSPLPKRVGLAMLVAGCLLVSAAR